MSEDEICGRCGAEFASIMAKAGRGTRPASTRSKKMEFTRDTAVQVVGGNFLGMVNMGDVFLELGPAMQEGYLHGFVVSKEGLYVEVIVSRNELRELPHSSRRPGAE